MTEQEALELGKKLSDNVINGKNNIIELKDYVEFVGIAAKTLEKQIVKPPKFETLKGGFVQKRCVVCGNKILPFYASYCTSCGQRLE